jgi:molybdopterin-guanine dinucleotide biosynthesis protein A
MTGIILAGGRNHRMETNKAFLEIDGVRIIDRTIRLYRTIFEEIIIVTNSPLLYLEHGVTVVTDFFKASGPLSGIYAGLFFASANHAFVCPCDMPFLNDSFIEHMIKLTSSNDIVVPYSGDGFQPLHAIYGKKCLPVAKKMLERGKLKISDMYKGLKVLTIKEDVIDSFDPARKMFFNVNTHEDMKKILTV